MTAHASELELWTRIAEAVARGEACVLATVVRTEGSTPRPAGARMLILANGGSQGTIGGGALEHAVMAAAPEVLRAGEPRLLSYRLKPDLGMVCGGSADVFLEPLLGAERLYIFGAGHIGQALAPIGAQLGFRVTVVDERAELACDARFPAATEFVRSFSPATWGALVFDQRSYCVVVSPGHKIDTEIVCALMQRPCAYVGMIGSATKRRVVENALRAVGVAEEQIAALHTPIGEPIGADSPAEIAVSIAAELVRHRGRARAPADVAAGERRPTTARRASGGEQRGADAMATPKLIDTLLLLALPASGKSEVRKYLASLSADACRDDFRLGPTVQLDDFPYVHLMRRIDEELAKLGRESVFFHRPDRPFREPIDWGTLIALLNEDYADLLARRRVTPPSHAEHLFERIDRARSAVGAPSKLASLGATRAPLAGVLEAEARELQKNREAEYPERLEGRTIVIEFARGGAHGSSMPLPAPFGYQYSLSMLSEEILARSSVLYIWVTPEESRRKNDARADPNDPGSILHHGVPIEVMMKDYGCDDIEHLLAQSGSPDTIRVDAHGKSFRLPLARFDNRVDKTSFVRNDRASWTPAQVQALHAGLKEAFARLAVAR